MSSGWSVQLLLCSLPAGAADGSWLFRQHPQPAAAVAALLPQLAAPVLLEAVARLPAQLAADRAGVDGVAPVVGGAGGTAPSPAATPIKNVPASGWSATPSARGTTAKPMGERQPRLHLAAAVTEAGLVLWWC